MGGRDCSGADGFLAKVVGVAGPKCVREKRRLDAWRSGPNNSESRSKTTKAAAVSRKTSCGSWSYWACSHRYRTATAGRGGGGGGVRPQVCSRKNGFLAKVAGLDGSKCDGEKRRLDVWMHHYYHRGKGGGCQVRELAKSGTPAAR
ncbi:hypothetical protein C2845_PM16G13470 [Panicum miliaceum]|uniref:Uncharacterized protein n=1 Tax=Panicum miliaceum TaxID=4540 RepID=A0A3L6PW61_PANMI|nr:hypothetical protein C2845_PM16G13470 [Panicum miliaceum]